MFMSYINTNIIKKICILILICLNFNVIFASEEKKVILNKSLPIKFNDNYVEFSNVKGDKVYPISHEGTTYLPIRSLSSLFNIPIEWDGVYNNIFLGEGELDTTSSKKILTFKKEENENIDVLINKKIKVYKDNVLQKFKTENGDIVYPISYQGTTYLPVRAISNLYNANIEWKAESREIEIKYVENVQPSIVLSNINFNGELKVAESSLGGHSGVYVNRAGEIVTFCEWQGLMDNVGMFYSNEYNIKESIEDHMKPQLNSKRYYFYITTLYDDTFINSNVFRILMKTPDKESVLDLYKESKDGLKLISQKRGEKYDLVKIKDDYTVENYLLDYYNTESTKNMVYTYGDEVYKVVELNNYAFGKKSAIEVKSNELFMIYYEDDKLEPSSYLLDMYLRDNDKTEIKEIYSFCPYVSYYMGVIYYHNGNVEIISLSPNDTIPNVAKVNSRELLKAEKKYSCEEIVSTFWSVYGMP